MTRTVYTNQYKVVDGHLSITTCKAPASEPGVLCAIQPMSLSPELQDLLKCRDRLRNELMGRGKEEEHEQVGTGTGIR